MSDDPQISCPECQTTQSARAPFCENCGYRIRRSDTVREGHQVVSPDALKRARRKRLAPSLPDRSAAGNSTPDRSAAGNSTSDAADAAPGDAYARSGHAASAKSPASAASGAEGADASTDSPQTYVEGLRSVESGRRRRAESGESASTEYDAAAPSAPPQRPAPASSGRLAVYVAISLSVTAVAVLATYFLTINFAGEAAEASGPGEVPARVEVPEGAFLRGLGDDVRSFILQMCQKVEDDPKETCKEKKLLAGEYPEKTVDLPAFAIDATEVSVADFNACAADGVCAPVDYKSCKVWTHQGLQIALRVPKALQDDAMPVTCVDLSQAKAYCEWAGGKLPSHDQWEKAARGDKGKLFPWGTSWSSELANWGEMDVAQNPIVGKLDGYEWTAPPARFPEGKSPYGAYDMAGNVAEWVDHGKGSNARTAVARGGAWTSHPFDLRTTHRLELDADARRTDVGFRCAYD